MKKISYFIFYAIIIFLPLAALLGNILEFKTAISSSQVFWIIHWYEIVLPFLLVWAIFSATKEKKVFGWPHLLAVLLIIYSVIIILFSVDRGRSLEGFRFTILPVVFFAVASLISFTKEEKNKIIKLYLIVAFIVAFWAIIERFLPIKYWNTFLIDPSMIFGWGWHVAGGFMQSASFLGGPNQLASYLLPALFLVVYRIQITDNRIQNTDNRIQIAEVYRIQNTDNRIQITDNRIQNTAYRIQITDNSKIVSKTVYCLLSTVILLAILLTQSRSAIVGLFVGFLLYIFLINKNKLIKYLFSGLFLVLAIILIFLYQTNTNFRTVVTHGGQTGHQTALTTTIAEIKNRASQNPPELIFGSGLGKAGPLAIKYGNGFISESWYLQLVLEIGLIGLAMWLWFIIALLRELLKNQEKGLFLGLLTVSIAALFLHTWADNPAISYTLFILLGLTAIKKNSN